MQRSSQPASVVKTVLTVFLALFVAIRVVAHPLILTASDPGVMAICSGGQIVYVSIHTGQPVSGDASESASDPCPFFGVTTFKGGEPPNIEQPTEHAVSLEAQLKTTAALGPRLNGANSARAPPEQA